MFLERLEFLGLGCLGQTDVETVEGKRVVLNKH
jgi:hypothetical protein